MTDRTIATEFPGYDESTLPSIPPGFVLQAWRNDICPVWAHPRGIMLCADWPNAVDRELPESPRYSLAHCGNDGAIYGDEIVSSDEWSDIATALRAMGIS